MVKKRIVHYSRERIRDVHGVGKILFQKPILKFFILLLVYITLISIEGFFKEEYFIRTVINIIGILISIYFIAVIVHIIRRSINRLINPENLFALILTYALFILGILLLFSTMFNFVEVLGIGYLKYGTCSSDFNSQMIKTDPQISRDFFYFSTTTFFTVGYGDICPMGFEKVISMITAFVGHLVSVIMVGLIINNYLKKKEMNER